MKKDTNLGRKLYNDARRRLRALVRARERVSEGRSVPCYQAKALLAEVARRLDAEVVADYGRILLRQAAGEVVDDPGAAADRAAALAELQRFLDGRCLEDLMAIVAALSAAGQAISKGLSVYGIDEEND